LILISGVLVFLLLLFYWIILGSQISTEEDNLDAAQQTNAQLQAQIAELQRFADLDAEVTAKRQALQTVMAGDIRWPALLTEVAMVIPGEVWLTNLAGSAGATEGAAPVGTETAAVRISNRTPVGRIQFSGNALSMPGVARWLIRQGTVDAFSAIWLNSASAAAPTEGVPGIVTFDSTLELGEDALSDRFQGGRL
jgi:Tfp pilus assembly protein PilN